MSFQSQAARSRAPSGCHAHCFMAGFKRIIGYCGQQEKGSSTKICFNYCKIGWIFVLFTFIQHIKTIGNSKMMNTIYLLVLFDPGIMTFNS